MSRKRQDEAAKKLERARRSLAQRMQPPRAAPRFLVGTVTAIGGAAGTVTVTFADGVAVPNVGRLVTVANADIVLVLIDAPHATILGVFQ